MGDDATAAFVLSTLAAIPLLLLVILALLSLRRRRRDSRLRVQRRPHLPPLGVLPEKALPDEAPGRSALVAAAPALPSAAPPANHILFIDVETTGLNEFDRIVSFGAVKLSIESGERSTLHLIFNPGIRCAPRAALIHGYSDALLCEQDEIGAHAETISQALGWAELVVAHNVAFDVRFIDAAMRRLGRIGVVAPTYCTMLSCRAAGHFPASLDAICGRLGLPRAAVHSALEDAWRDMQVFLWLTGRPYAQFSARALDPLPTNIRAAPAAAPSAAAPMTRPDPVRRSRGRPRKQPETVAQILENALMKAGVPDARRLTQELMKSAEAAPRKAADEV